MYGVLCSDAWKLGLLDCGHVFTDHVTRWLEVIRHVVLQRVERAVQLDTVRMSIMITMMIMMMMIMMMMMVVVVA